MKSMRKLRLKKMNPPVTQIIASHLLFLFVRAKKIAANQRPGFLQKKNPLTRAEKNSTHQIELTTPINTKLLQLAFLLGHIQREVQGNVGTSVLPGPSEGAQADGLPIEDYV
jgi:hypothetical protein